MFGTTCTQSCGFRELFQVCNIDLELYLTETIQSARNEQLSGHPATDIPCFLAPLSDSKQHLAPRWQWQRIGKRTERNREFYSGLPDIDHQKPDFGCDY